MKNLLTIMALIAFIFIFVGLMPVHGEAELYDSVLRLHVLANSDSEEDQALKLKVRDSILEASATIMQNCKTREDATAAITAAIPTLTSAASETIKREGFDYHVHIELCEESYPTKSYESFCFPSGNYLSLRIIIGEGEGQNWWCVMYPPLCVGAATDRKKATSLWNNNQKKLVQGGDRYVVKFKVVEWAQKALGIFRRK